MTDDHIIFGFIDFCEVSSQFRLDSECAKEIRCDVDTFDAFERLRAIKIDGKRSPRGDAFEALTLLAKVEDIDWVEKGSTDAQRRISIGHPDDSLCVSVRQRPDQDRKHYTEDRGVGTDTERKHECCDDDKTATSRECSTGIAKVLPGVGDWSKRLRIVLHVCE